MGTMTHEQWLNSPWFNSPERKRYFDERDALADQQINCPEDIAKLPWHGNHASDMGLFTACEKLILRLTDREEQKKALLAMAKYGTGEDDLIGIDIDAELDNFLASSILFMQQ